MIAQIVAIATAKKTVPAVWAISFFALAYDPTALGAALVALIIALSNTWMAYLKNKSDAADRAMAIASAAADRAAAAEERRLALAEAAAERELAADERRVNVAERKALLAEAERTAKEMAVNTLLTAETAKILTKVDAETQVISGHVNSQATAADADRKAYAAEKEATRVEREREVAMLKEIIEHQRREAATLAREKANADALAAVRDSSAAPRTEAPETSSSTEASLAGIEKHTEATAEEARAIKENTARTVEATARTDAAVQELKDNP